MANSKTNQMQATHKNSKTIGETYLYPQAIEQGYAIDHVCSICGSELQIHGYSTLQCPVNGIDSPTTFVPLETQNELWKEFRESFAVIENGTYTAAASEFKSLQNNFIIIRKRPFPDGEPSKLLSKDFDLGAYADRLVGKIFGEVKNVEL